MRGRRFESRRNRPSRPDSIGRVVMEDVQSEVIQPDEIAGDGTSLMISSMAIQPWMESRWSGGMRQNLHYITHMYKYAPLQGC